MTLNELVGGGNRKLNLVLLLTDICSSTKMAQKRGDDAWIEILVKHFARARELRDQHNCAEIKLIGDAYMAAFRTADEALKFAKEFFIDPGHPELIIRAAIHVGRVLTMDGDIYGLMVNKTARIVQAHEGSGIVLSDQAKNDVIDVWGESVMTDFKSRRVELKNFGPTRIWDYHNREMLTAFRRERRVASRDASSRNAQLVRTLHSSNAESASTERPRLPSFRPPNDATAVTPEQQRMLDAIRGTRGK